ncbi:MAG: GTP-binding protein [Thermoplasmata archaeon]|nr:MAG: GTP-binding protein [Thermoplasmata archaeon]
MALKKKIVLLGDSAVGKTSLIRRYVFNQFEFSYVSTVGSKVTKKKLTIPAPNKTVDITFMIWDIIGREGYHALHARTFVGVHGAILVTDLTRKETLENLEKYWIPFLLKVVKKVPMVFVCNKSDLTGEYEFEFEELEEIAQRYNDAVDEILPAELKSCYLTSAKDGLNVEKAFETLGHFVLTASSLQDPVKKISEVLKATSIRRTTDKTTPIGALDAIIVDFCEDFNDSRISMIILRQEIARAGINIDSPTKEGIFKVVEYLAEAEHEFIDEEKVFSNLEKRMEWAKKIQE